MALPSHYSTGTATVRELAGDFTSGVYSGVAVTRASSATYFDADGIMQTAAPDTLRIAHDPVTGEVLGALVEPAATNVVRESSDITVSPWSDPLNRWSVTSSSTVAPDGTLTVQKITIDVAAAIVRQNYAGMLNDGQQYIFSVWIRRVSGSGNITVDAGDGPVAGLTVTSTLTRQTVVVTAGSQDWLDISFSDTGVFEVWGAQLETGAVATSYISTGVTVVTRAADTLTIAASGTNDWSLTLGDDSNYVVSDHNGDLSITFDDIGNTIVKSFVSTLNSSTVYGQNTFWIDKVRPGDLFGTHVGRGVRIATVVSDTELTLAYPWSGPAQTATAYEVQIVGDVGRAQEQTRRLLERLAFIGSGEHADILTASAATIPADQSEVIVAAYDATVSATRGRAHYRRVAAEPLHDLKFRSADRYMPDQSESTTNGGWWEISDPYIEPAQAGAIGISGTDDGPALRRAFVAAAMVGVGVWIVNDVYPASRVLVPSNCHVYGMGGTVYNEHVQSVAGNANGLFISENIDDPTNVEVENIGFHGLRIRDNILSSEECFFFGITNCDGFTLEDCDIVKASVGWTTSIAADNVRILNNKIDTTGSDQFADGIHILEGSHGIIAGNILDTEDDCIALHNHSYAPFKRGNIIKDWTIYGNSCRSAIANGLRIGAASTASADFYVDGVTAEKSNHFYSGVMFQSLRTARNEKHRNIIVSCGICEERISQPSSEAEYRDITLLEANANPTGNWSTAQTPVAINFAGRGVDIVKLKRCRINEGNRNSGTNTILILANERIEIVDNDVEVNSSQAGVLLNAPEIIDRDNRFNATAASFLVRHIAPSTLNYCEIVGNILKGTASVGLSADGGAYLVIDRNRLDSAGIATQYGLGTFTAGAGKLFGTGAPAMVVPNSIEYFRTDGGTNTTRYLREAGAWVAK